MGEAGRFIYFPCNETDQARYPGRILNPLLAPPNPFLLMPFPVPSSSPGARCCAVPSEKPTRSSKKPGTEKGGLRRLLLLGAGVLLAGHGRAQGTGEYRIAGDVHGLPNGANVYLIHGGQRKTIDSATVNNRRFVLRGHLAEPAHVYLHAGRGKNATKLADILLDNRALSVTGGAPDYDSVRVSGSAIDRQWKDWLKEDEHIGQQRRQLKQVAQALLAKKDTANAGALNKVIGELQAARVRLLKAYVQRYRATAAGAALPTLCTLGPSLTGGDYLEMYRTLTPTWQQSSFGKEIISQATQKGATPTGPR